MPRPHILAVTSAALFALSLGVLRAEELKGKARRDYERATSEGSLSTACSPTADTFTFWAGQTPSAVTVDGKTEPVQFEHHKVGDYLTRPYRCQMSEGLLTITTKLTHSISNSQCGAGNDFIAKLSVAKLGSYADDFLVDGCGATTGLLVRGKHVLLCRLPDGSNGTAQCAEAADARGPRQLQ